MTTGLATLLTALQIVWSVAWARKHLAIRARRRYAAERRLVLTHRWYKPASMVVFAAQNIVTIACFWSSAAWLLKFHESEAFHLAGALATFASTWLYFAALRHLGHNYSPCFDSHLPFEVVTSGPYRWVRHPMYLAKIGLGVGTLLLSGSLWFLPLGIALVVTTLRQARKEEAYLLEHMPAYRAFYMRTPAYWP